WRAVAEPGVHDGEGLRRRERGAVPRPGMVRVAMGDDGVGDGPIWVDIEVTRTAIEPFGVDLEPRVESVRLHFFRTVSRISRIHQPEIELAQGTPSLVAGIPGGLARKMH